MMPCAVEGFREASAKPIVLREGRPNVGVTVRTVQRRLGGGSKEMDTDDKKRATRLEADSIGQREVPADALYGIQALRGSENFPIVGQKMHRGLVIGLAMVKKAAALANMELGYLPSEIGLAIAAAADEIIAGKHLDQFIVEAVQGGAGTSMNMNANEVIANRASEILGGSKGADSLVSPLNHVNLGQSTNDSLPTAARLALLNEIGPTVEALRSLADAMRSKGEEFKDVIKMGRTHLQDAVPITLGQELCAWSRAIGRDADRIENAAEALKAVNLGGTAVGTGLNADLEYIRLAIENLRKISGYDLESPDDFVDATQNLDSLAFLSACLKVCAINLIKIANDIRLLASGPMSGLFEIQLPAVQPGSSIMPAKVNPVIAEVVNQVGFQVLGNDLAVTMAAQAGQLELNVFQPVLLHNLLQSIGILGNAARIFRDKCILGIKANRDRCAEMVEKNVGLVTALVPYIGYQPACDIAEEARTTGRSIRSLVMERGLMTKEELDQVLSPARVTRPGKPDAELNKHRLAVARECASAKE